MEREAQGIHRDDDELTDRERMGEDEPMTHEAAGRPAGTATAEPEVVEPEVIEPEAVQPDPLGSAAGEPTADERAADEQRTPPEDREAASAAEDRDRTPHQSPPGAGAERPFELFQGGEMDDYRRRWDTLQAGFVDDPRGSAQQADALIGELVDRVSTRHQELREQLGDGTDGGDTEAMRMALRQYRDFFSVLIGGAPSRTI